MNTQHQNNIYVFDLDNTLIKTDKANNLAYYEAIYSVLGVKIEYGQRLTRNRLKTIFPDLDETQFNKIVAYKEKCIESYIKETVLNQKLFGILKRLYQEGHHTILLTNSHSHRAISLCNYYGLTKYFVRRFFYEDCPGNKYAMLKSLGYDLQNVVLYENEEYSSSKAIENGINSEKIIKIEF